MTQLKENKEAGLESRELALCVIQKQEELVMAYRKGIAWEGLAKIRGLQDIAYDYGQQSEVNGKKYQNIANILLSFHTLVAESKLVVPAAASGLKQWVLDNMKIAIARAKVSPNINSRVDENASKDMEAFLDSPEAEAFFKQIPLGGQ